MNNSDGAFYHIVMQILETSLRKNFSKTSVDTSHTEEIFSRFDIQYVLERPCSSAKATRHRPDRDWEYVDQLRAESPAMPKLIRVYDEEHRCIFHVQQTPPKPHSTHSDRNSGESKHTPTPARRPIDLDPGLYLEVEACLDRLVPEIWHFAPLMYEKWMARKLSASQDALNRLDRPFRDYGTLCECCRVVLTHSTILYSNIVDPRAWVKSERFRHHGSLGGLERSSRAGCHLCSLLVSSLDYSDERYREVFDSFYLLVVTGRGCLGVHVLGQRLGKVVPTFIPSILFGETEPTVRFSHTGSAEIGKLVRRWLTECLSLHTECPSRHPTLASFVPTRLVKVTASAGAVKSAQLIHGTELPMGTRYLTLSHCWGDFKFTMLTKETLQDFQSEIPQSELTKTFRDALQVTVWLGYEYIWIDALCILQDCDEDWRAESASMGSVYRHSTCTIAALGARDGSDGLFYHRSAPAVTSCPILQDGSRKMYAMDPQRYREPLLERAWVLQEQCLSTRTLCFGLNQVSWTCKTTRWSEIPRDADPWNAPKIPLALFTQLVSPTPQPPNPWNRVNKDWETLLDYYTKRRLGSRKDKYAALQGLSSEVAKARRWHMVHGLWTHSWTEQLLWSARRPEKNVRSLELGAPSWSWLNVHDHGYLDQECSEVNDADIALHPDSDRVLCIRGRMERLNILKATPRPTAETPQQDSHAAQLSARGWTGWYPDTAGDGDWDAWGIQLTKSEASRRDGSYEFVSCGLVVVSVDAQRGVWKRVGTYRSTICVSTTVDGEAEDVVPFPVLLRPWFNGEKREMELI
jgi:hypothetical protein